MNHFPYLIQTTYETSNPELTCLCLEIIGCYVSWIDITLIANDRFVTVLLRFMAMPLLRESACDCIHEIISKGMDPIAKTKLIESFITVLSSAGLLDIQAVSTVPGKTSLERPLPQENTCLQGQRILGRRFKITMEFLNWSPKVTYRERPYF